MSSAARPAPAHPAISFWFSQLGGRPAPRPALPGPREADVCIVGGGFTGLWTAYELRRADPSLEVVVLEREIAGFGASGRNGGWVVGELSGARSAWVARGGHAGALALERAIQDTVDEVGRVVTAERIDCDYRKGGSLHVAQSATELARIAGHVAADYAFGLEAADSVLLDAAATRERVAVRGALGARYTPHCARVQPARLARGLAEAAERAGGVVHEDTPVTEIGPHVARTPMGDVRARWVVRATEGYTADLPGLERVLAPVSSSMIVTEQLPAAAWTRIGWEACETMLDGRHLYAYLQRTADGRIAIGGRGTPYRYGARTDREDPLAAKVVAGLQRRLLGLFGEPADVPVAAAWHGVLGVPRTWLPAVGIDAASGLAWAGGYAGEGVAAANLAARTLRDLILGRSSELTRLPWVGDFTRRWEPEPLRFAGIHGVHRLLAAGDRAEARSGRPSRLAVLADRIAGR